MQKTLGGDRLGAGKRMKVDLHGYERSTHDLGYLWRSTLSAGTLVPFLNKIGLPGDTFDIGLDCDIKTHPTIGPLFGSYKVQLDIFQAPIRLYQAMLHNNALNIGRKMSDVKLPQIEMTATVIAEPALLPDLDNAQVNPSSLLAYLGIRGVGIQTSGTPVTREFNALSILAYWEIYKNYYSNKQEEIGAVIHTPSVALVTITGVARSFPVVNIFQTGTGTSFVTLEAGHQLIVSFTPAGTPPILSQIVLQLTSISPKTIEQLISSYIVDIPGGTVTCEFDWATWGDLIITNWDYISETTPQTGAPSVVTFPLENIDTMRNTILQYFNTTIPFQINNANIAPYKYLYEQPEGIPNVLSSQEGLGLKTYQSDLFNNWLSTEWIDGPGGISEITAISTVGDSFTLDQLLLSRKVYDMLNRIAVSGGTYDDWLDVVYDHERYQRCESPMYMGGLSKELVFQEVVSNSQAEGDTGQQPLGTLAGKGVMANKHKGGHVTIKVDEPCVILGLISLTPRIDYSQGNDWTVHLRTMDDLHKPALDEIGFQELITEQMAWWDTRWNTSEWVQKSAGKQPAWINYMTSVNEVRGNFAMETNEMFMTLNRRYEYDNAGTIKDLTTYIDPSKYNNIFANTALDAQNFWAQIAVNITARRKMSAKLMPNL